jgi:RimJ/RimL family protein N-acetyltransferase
VHLSQLLSDLELMRLHVEAEFTHDDAGQLVSTNDPTSTPAPRFFLGHTALGVIRRYRNDVRETRRHALEVVLAAELESSMIVTDRPLDPTPFVHILSQDAPVQHTSVGLAFRFPSALPLTRNTRILRDPTDAALLHPSLAAWASDIQSSPPLAGLFVDGQVVAVCASVRITPQAHEAGVETAAPLRGRGYATAVVAAWAVAVRALGVEPLYSTTWRNAASRAVAHSLGLVSVGRDLHIT